MYGDQTAEEALDNTAAGGRGDPGPRLTRMTDATRVRAGAQPARAGRTRDGGAGMSTAVAPRRASEPTSPEAGRTSGRPGCGSSSGGCGGSASAYLFIAPGVIIFSVFTVAALIFAFYLTFHRWSIIEPDKPYVGLQNYEDMIHDERLRRSRSLNTFYFTGASVPLTMVIGLALALLLNQPLRGRAIFRTAYYLPVVTPFVVVGAAVEVALQR